MPATGVWFCTHFLIHGIHHGFPQDRYRLVFPVMFAIVIALVMAILFCGLMGVTPGIFVFAGFGWSYVLYDIMHYSFHHIDLDIGFYKKLKVYHGKHHYKDPKAGYGVTSPLWDYVFGTVLYY